VYYLGRRHHLHPDLLTDAFQASCLRLGLRFEPRVELSQWCDYSQADAVVALRPTPGPHANKPGSKLVNCWHAGVPAILGDEIAFQRLRENDLDYLEATTPQQVLEALTRLKIGAGLRNQMIENGRKRAVEYTDEAITKIWMELLSGPLLRDAQDWFASRSRRSKMCARFHAAQAYDLLRRAIGRLRARNAAAGL
jgi:hypothetical protein